jgi:hypothetical protein
MGEASLSTMVFLGDPFEAGAGVIAASEEINSKIQRMSKMAHGFRNQERLNTAITAVRLFEI